jgi:hypothetical protein
MSDALPYPVCDSTDPLPTVPGTVIEARWAGGTTVERYVKLEPAHASTLGESWLCMTKGQQEPFDLDGQLGEWTIVAQPILETLVSLGLKEVLDDAPHQ